MSEATITTLDLSTLSPLELEARRRSIVGLMTTKYKGYDDPDLPRSLLHELAVITSTLRRKNAGPPKAAKAPRGAKPKTTLSDVLDLL